MFSRDQTRTFSADLTGVNPTIVILTTRWSHTLSVAADIATSALIIRQADRWRRHIHAIAFKANLFTFTIGFNTTLGQNFFTLSKTTGKVFITIAVHQAFRWWWQTTALLAGKALVTVSLNIAVFRGCTIEFPAPCPDCTLVSQATIKTSVRTTAPTCSQPFRFSVPAELSLTLSIVGVTTRSAYGHPKRRKAHTLVYAVVPSYAVMFVSNVVVIPGIAEYLCRLTHCQNRPVGRASGTSQHCVFAVTHPFNVPEQDIFLSVSIDMALTPSGCFAVLRVETVIRIVG